MAGRQTLPGAAMGEPIFGQRFKNTAAGIETYCGKQLTKQKKSPTTGFFYSLSAFLV